MTNSMTSFIDTLCGRLNKIDSSEFDVGNKQTKQKIISDICSVLVDFTSSAHEAKHNIDWSYPNPEWYDHRCDQFFQFSKRRNSHWVERGVYSSIILKPSSNILELCSGDGFNTYHFYSNRCNSIDAIDFDKSAYDHAVDQYNLPNINFILGDIRTDLPDKQYDAIIWDTAIEHFTEEEITTIMKRLKNSMNEGAVLTGHTIKENGTGGKMLPQHEREFTSKEDLAQFFEPYFKNVCVFETIHPDRHNYYFYASDFALPFSTEWEGTFKVSR